MKKIWLCLAVVALLPGLNGCRGKAGSEGPLPVLDFRADIPKRMLPCRNWGKCVISACKRLKMSCWATR